MRYLAILAAAALLSIGAFASRGTSPANAVVDTALYGSSDYFVISSLGINAPVNVRNVAEDGRMGDPAGKDDVVRYDFPSFPGLGGYPGAGGTTVIAGHVDYHPHYEAVFWTLRQAKVGTRIDYYRSDGVMVSYSVDWIGSLTGEDDVTQYVASTDPETMVLISCEGTFDASTRHYNNRTIVHAVRIA